MPSKNLFNGRVNIHLFVDFRPVLSPAVDLLSQATLMQRIIKRPKRGWRMP
jgi:hypothetical protein